MAGPLRAASSAAAIPHARLRDMDALGTDQVMLFPTVVRAAGPGAERRGGDGAGAGLQRLGARLLRGRPAPPVPCAVLPLQSVEASIAELRRVATLGFKAAAVRPCFWNGRYPTLPEFDPLWREFEATGVVLAMHTFPSREALTPEWGQRMAEARGHSGQGLLFTDESVVYSPGPVRVEHHRRDGSRDRRLGDARLPHGGNDVGDRSSCRPAGSTSSRAQGRGAGVQRVVAAR
jgi:hypothetical protein